MPHSPPVHSIKYGKSPEIKRIYDKNVRVNQSFYDSPAWRKVRATYKRANPLCVSCKAEGFAIEAKVIDHIIEIKDGGAALSYSNLQSLCHKCHNRKTAEERSKRNA
jgi:5-methylcytosine-specific restriction protein A